MFSLLSSRLFLCQSTSHTAVALFRYLTLTCLPFSTLQAPHCLPWPPSTLCVPPTSSGRHSVHLCQNVWLLKVHAFFSPWDRRVIMAACMRSRPGTTHPRLYARQPTFWGWLGRFWVGIQFAKEMRSVIEQRGRRGGWKDGQRRAAGSLLRGWQSTSIPPSFFSLSHCNFKKLGRN